MLVLLAIYKGVVLQCDIRSQSLSTMSFIQYRLVF